jgi:hypothetical protein
MSKAAALFSIGFWSMASFMILMAIAADRRTAATHAPSQQVVSAVPVGVDYRGDAR